MNIGITNRGHRKRLMLIIDYLPPEEVFQEVPVSEKYSSEILT